MPVVASYVKRLLVVLLLLALAGAILLFGMYGASPYLWSWLWGTLGSALYLIVLGTNVMRAGQMDPVEGRKHVRRTMVVRLAVALFFLLIAGRLWPSQALVATGCGLLLYRVALYIDYGLLQRYWPSRFFNS